MVQLVRLARFGRLTFPLTLLQVYGECPRRCRLFMDGKDICFTSGICGIVFIGLAIVLHNMYHNLNTMPESGFHLKVDNPALSNNHGDNDL